MKPTEKGAAITGPIVYVDRSRVRPGQIDELDAAVGRLVEHVAAHPGGVVSYGIFFSDDRSTMTVVHVHPDARSLETLMETLAPILPPFADLLDVESIDVYGEPGEMVRAQLRRKTDLLGGTVTVHRRAAGIEAVLET